MPKAKKNGRLSPLEDTNLELEPGELLQVTAGLLAPTAGLWPCLGERPLSDARSNTDTTGAGEQSVRKQQQRNRPRSRFQS